MENCIIFDLDGTLVDTAPDLMMAHNHVMKKYGYPEQPASSIRFLAGRGATDDRKVSQYSRKNSKVSDSKKN